MSIDGIDLVVGPIARGAATWAELIYVVTAPAPRVPTLPVPPPSLEAYGPPGPQPQFTGFLIHRELLDPTQGYTIQSATDACGYSSHSTTPYAMDWTTKLLQRLLWTDTLDINMTMVLLEGDIDGGPAQVTHVLQSLCPILPHRMIWPIWANNNPRPIPPPIFNPLPALHPTGRSLS